MADDYTEDLVNPETGEYAPIRPSGVPIPQGYAPVSQDPNVPLPDVEPDSAMVPYRIGRRPPGGEYTYTTGYGPRARPPIQPPQGMGIGGAGTPDMAGFLGEAMQHLPVDQAIQAADAAQRYVGYRLYKQALDRGEPADKAWGQYGMMMLKTGTGIPEVLKMQMQREQANQGVIRPGSEQGLYRITPSGGAQQLVAPTPKPLPAPKLHVNATTGEILQETGDPNNPFKVAREGSSKTGFESGPVQGQPVLDPETKKPIEGLIATPSAGGKGMTVRLTPKAQAELTPSAAAEYFKNAPDIDRMMGLSPKAPGSFTRRMATNMVDIASRKVEKKELPNPAQTNEVIRTTKDGRKAVFDADTKKFIRYAQ